MSLTATKGSDFKQIEPGTYLGIYFRLIDLGTQHGEYEGRPTARHQVLISWEFPTELIDEGDYAGQPYSLSKFYTISLDKRATLRSDLVCWRGREFTEQELEGFDLKNILGKACMITVIAGKNGKSQIKAITPVPKGFVVPKGVNLLTAFDIDVWDSAVFDALPDGIKNMIMQSDEAKKPKGGEARYEETISFNPDDDTPF